MERKPMKILIIEDDANDRNNLIEASKNRKDIEIVGLTDSDVEAIKMVKSRKPEGIILDLELNHGREGNTDSFGFLADLKALKLNYMPIVIVTTHVNSPRTYDILHREGVDLILYKDHPSYSCNNVFNRFISLRKTEVNVPNLSVEDELKSEEEKISDCIKHELDLIGISANLKGRQYIHDAVLFLIQNDKKRDDVIQYLGKVHKKSNSTITNGIQNAIIHGWRVSATEDLEKYYTAKINYNTGLPTPMELIYYYADKVKRTV